MNRVDWISQVISGYTKFFYLLTWREYGLVGNKIEDIQYVQQ